MNKLTILASFLASATSLSAATYSVGNAAGINSNQITDSNGTLLIDTNGALAFGTFSSDAAVTSATSAATLLDSDWTEFGSSETTFDPTSIIIGSGIGTASGTSIDTNFNGDFVYLVTGDATSLSSASEFFVYKFNATFSSVEGPSLVTLTLGNDAGTILLGKVGPDIINTGFGGSTADASFQTASFSAVPEPSSTALLGLGSLGLLLLRRR